MSFLLGVIVGAAGTLLGVGIGSMALIAIRRDAHTIRDDAIIDPRQG